MVDEVPQSQGATIGTREEKSREREANEAIKLRKS